MMGENNPLIFIFPRVEIFKNMHFRPLLHPLYRYTGIILRKKSLLPNFLYTTITVSTIITMRFQVISVALLCSSAGVYSFTSSPNRALAPKVSASAALGPLHVGAAMHWNEQDLDESFLMKRAEACAHSDSCSLQEARKALDDVLRVQSGCLSGTVLGSVCENVDIACEIVAELRQKIEQKSKEAMVVATGVNLVTVSMTMVAMALLASGLAAANADSSSFTLQEWWWSVRDGYLPQMLSHYFRHGGLATLDDYDSETTALTLQEWWWALKGGYLNTMTEHYFRNGGLATAEGFVPGVVSITPNEWLLASKGGYLDTMIHHNFYHGGLASAESSSLDDTMQAMKATPQEIFWAARDGYVGELSQHIFRNGGV